MMKKRTIEVGCLVLALLAIFGAAKIPVQEADTYTDQVLPSEEDASGEAPKTEEDPYWGIAEELLKAYVADGYETSFFRIQDAEYMANTDLTEPKEKLYQCLMEKTEGEELVVPFCIWVEKVDNGYLVETDFKQSLFRWALLNSYLEHEGKLIQSDVADAYYTPNYFILWHSALLCAVLPADSGYASPYYGCLGEDMILSSKYDAEDWEPIFKDAYETMYEYQKKITGDLSQKIRFSDEYAPSYYRGDAGEKKTSEDFENVTDYQTYTTAWLINISELAYQTWREDYETAGGIEYVITFDTEYGETQRQLLEVMCNDRDARSASSGETKKAAEEERTYNVYIVKEGDSLWKIAEEQYGDANGCYQRIYEENRDVIGSDMNLIIPGMELRLYLEEGRF